MRVVCMHHPKYKANRKSNCESCSLLYVLRWQYTKDADKKIGGINPYQFLDLETACDGLRGELK
jgi:hypothetical protein